MSSASHQPFCFLLRSHCHPQVCCVSTLHQAVLAVEDTARNRIDKIFSSWSLHSGWRDREQSYKQILCKLDEEAVYRRSGGQEGRTSEGRCCCTEDAQRFDTTQSLEGWASHGDLPERTCAENSTCKGPCGGWAGLGAVLGVMGEP